MELCGLLVGCWLAVPYKPTTCRLSQQYAGKPEIATSTLLVLWLVAVPVAGFLTSWYLLMFC